MSYRRRLTYESLESRRMLSWTVMVYMEANNNLSGFAVSNFDQMASVGSTDEVNIVVQADLPNGFNRYGLVNKGDVLDDTWGAVTASDPDMGDPTTVVAFIDWATTNYQADHYALILWDHGGGVNYGVCFDNDYGYCSAEYTGGDNLTISELTTVLQSAPSLDVIGFDACLMGMTETAYQVRDEANVMVASEANIPGEGWQYDAFLAQLVVAPGMTAQTLGNNIVAAYGTYYASKGYADCTLSEIDLDKVSDLAAASDAFADYMLTSVTGNDWSAVYDAHDASQVFPTDEQSTPVQERTYQYYDLGDWMTRIVSGSASDEVKTLAQDVLDALSRAVIANYAGSSVTANGLSIYAPFAETCGYYDSVDFVADTDWEPFVGPHGMDVVTILDHSGSMDYEGKMEAAQDAADAFINLLTTDATNGDKIGVVSYSTTATTEFSLTQITDDSIKEAAIAAVDSLYPTDMTSIGAGLYAADVQLDTDPAARVRAMLLLTDGLENTSPYAMNVINSSVASDIVIYTIGLGSDADGTLLSQIAAARGGQYYYAASSADIRSIYLALSAKLAGMQTALRTSGTIQQGQQVTENVLVDSLSSQATFSLDWEGSDMDLTLIAPDGTQINASNVSSFPDISLIEEDTYEVFTVNSPAAGQWQLVVDGVSVPSGGETFHLLVSVDSPIQMDISTDNISYSTGDVIHVQAALADYDAILGASVTATIEDPNGTDRQITLYDDGLHEDGLAGDGVYGNDSSVLSMAGSYTVTVNAEGHSNYGMSFVRTDFQSVSVTGDAIEGATVTSLITDHPSGSVYGEEVTFTATVSEGTGSGTPTGAVQFVADGVNLGSAVTLVGGTASIVVSSLDAGAHSIEAVYSSDNSSTFQDSQTASPLAFEVTPAPLTITADDLAMPYGAPVPALTASYDGFVNGETAADLDVAVELSTDATSDSPVGTYTITASGASDANYAITCVEGALTVCQAEAAVAIASSPGLVSVYAQPVTFTVTLSAVAPSLAIPTGTVVFRDGAVVLACVAIEDGTATFTTSTLGRGTHKINAVFQGDDNWESGSQARLMQIVQTVSLECDSLEPDKFTLAVGGTAGSDYITISYSKGTNRVVILVTGAAPYFGSCSASTVAHVALYGGSGNDILLVNSGVPMPALLFGGEGNDRLLAWASSSVLVGGDGNDVLCGGNGRDLLIGGRGIDSLIGGGNDDVLVGGATDHDLDLAALELLMAEWSRTDATYTQRVNHLLGPGAGGTAGGLNAAVFLNRSTVRDDAACDYLFGDSGNEWLFAGSGRQRDFVFATNSREIVTYL